MDDIYKRLVERFGKKTQIDKIQEEAMELALALHQLKCPTKDNAEGLDKVYNELADVTIMFRQVPHLFDMKRLEKEIARKLKEAEELYLKPELDFGQKPKPVKDYPPEVHYILEECLPHFEEHLRPDEKALPSWLDVVDKLLRLDKVPPDTIVKVVAWARTSKFWRPNFLSMVKLRKKNRSKIAYIVVFSEQMKKEIPQLTEQEKKDQDNRALRFLKED